MVLIYKSRNSYLEFEYCVSFTFRWLCRQSQPQQTQYPAGGPPNSCTVSYSM